MITRVKLKNWKSHRDTDFRLGDGTNVLVGSMGSGKSLPYDELVVARCSKWGKYKIGELVEDALKNANEIHVKGDTEFTENSKDILVQCLNLKTLKIEPKKVTAFIRHKNSSPLLKLRTRTGRSITVSKDHSLLMLDEMGRIVPRKGSEIKVGDFLPCAKTLRTSKNSNTPIDTREILPDFRPTDKILHGLDIIESGLSRERAGELVGVPPYVLDNWKRRKMSHKPGFIIGRYTRSAIPTNLPLSAEFAILAGAYLSEGCSSYYTGKSACFRISSKRREILEEVARCLRKIFPDVRYQLTEKELRVNSRVIAAFFARLFGPNAATKRIPNFIYEADENSSSAFLGAYFDGDGWIEPNRTEVACISKSLDLIDGLQTILSKWGIIGTIRERKVNGMPYYQLTILPKHILLLQKHLNFLTQNKRKKLQETTKIVENRKRWDGIDVIPNIKKLLRSLRLEYHLSSRKNPRARDLSQELSNYLRNQNIGREKLRRYLKNIFEIYEFKSKSFCMLETIADSDVFFDKVVEVKEVEPKSNWVYDISVESAENFVAGYGNLIVHNSAVLDAITFALFGTLPVVKARLAKLDDLITNRPKPMGSAEIEVQFIAPDGEEYVVKRVIERGEGTTLSELRKSSGELIESPSSTRVSEVIQSILKLDYDLFERAIYSEQNRLDYFLVLPRGKRMESIDELLRIDKLELARKNMTTLMNRARVHIDDLRALVAQLWQDATLMALPALEGELKEVELSIRETASKLQRVQPELDAVRAELGRMREVEQKILQLDKSISGIEGDIGAIGRQIDQIKGRLGEAAGLRPEELEQRLGELQQTYGRVSTSVEEMSARLTTNTSLAAELAARVAMLRERLERLSVDVERKRGARGQLEQLKPKELSELAERLQSDYRKVSDELAACNTRAQDLKGALSELAVAGPVCPVCESPLPEEKKQALLRKREKQLEVYNARLSELGSELVKLDGDLRGTLELLDRAKMLAKEVEDLPKLEGESSQLIPQIGELEAKLKETRSTVEKLRSDAEQSRAEVEAARERLLAIQQALQLRRDLDRLELERRQKQAEGLKAQRELWQLRRTYDESRVRGLERRLEELVGEHGRLSADLAGKERLLTERRRLVDAVREKRAMLERSEVEVKYIQQAVDALGTIQAALAQTQLTLRRDFIEGVNGAMQELWREVYPYGDLTSIRLDVREGDYVLQVCDRLGNWIPVEGIASGGERTDACLALRMAFAMVLAPALSWLVLDEPTHNLDEEGIRELASVLRERIPEVVRQVLLITHEERLEAAVSGYLYRFSRNKEEDEPTRVEHIAAPEL